MVNTAADIPQNKRLLPENINPTRPITKQTVPSVINGRIFSADKRRPMEYCSVTTIAAFTGSTTAITSSAKSLSATTITYCDKQDAKAPQTNEARQADKVNQSR